MTDNGSQPAPSVRTGQGSTKLTREEFERRWREHFYNPIFDSAQAALQQLAELAWQAYEEGTKSPRTRKAGPEFADPEFELAIEWLDARRQVQMAADRHRDAGERPADDGMRAPRQK